MRPPPLRPYQLEPLRAITRSIREQAGRSFVVEISRQGGKNELSARIEAVLLYANRVTGGTIVKTAPTLQPQLITSFNRLARYLDADGLPHRTAWPQIHMGAADIDFRSAEKSANVVGATASLLLEVDEAQDVAEDIFDQRFRPMAATTNATTVYYGTAWDETDLLQRALAQAQRDENRDGIRRAFVYPWQEVAQHNDRYRRFVENEIARLGPTHPLFTTQYELKPLEGGGRLFNAAQLAQLQGSHPRQTGPALGVHYVAAVDIAGEDTGGDRTNDRTVMTIGKLRAADAAQQLAGVRPVDVVQHIVAQGSKHSELIPQLAAELKRWGVRALTVDATGIGQSTASILAATVPGCKVEGFTFTQSSKSALGFGLLTAVNTGALRLYRGDGSSEHNTLIRELTLARRETLPNRTMRFYVHEADGNDDYLMSLALLAHTAAQNPVRRAVGRQQ